MTPAWSPASRRALAIGAAAVATMVTFEALFRPFFPIASGEISADYAYYFPHLYDGAQWFHVNGPFALPWFTPSFCGGIPAYPNPQSGYYALPQLLDLVAGPMFAVHATVLAFAAIAYGSMYLLARRVFACGAVASSFAAAIFALDGFYLRRMVAGHIGFHPFALVPLIAWSVLRPRGSRPMRFERTRDACIGGTAIAYTLHAGAVQIVVPMVLAVVGVALVVGVSRSVTRDEVRRFVVRFTGALAIASMLAAGKLAGAMAFLGQNPRALYSLPGVRYPSDLVDLVLRPLFGSPPMETLGIAVVNTRWDWNVSEFELSVGPVPAILLGVGAAIALVRLARRGLPAVRAIAISRAAFALALALLLALPLVLNVYDPALEAFVKRVPLLRSAHSFFRFLSIYVPVVVVASALVLQRARDARLRGAVAVVGVVLLVLSYRSGDHYYGGGYSPRAIVAADARLRATGDVRAIDAIDRLTLDDDAGILAGNSALPCYEPMFGYLLEVFPKNDLHRGPVTDVTGDAFNLLDPSCFVFPRENGCVAGDRIPTRNRSAFDALRAHRAYPFALPWWQRAADGLSVLTLGALAIAGAAALAMRLRGKASS